MALRVLSPPSKYIIRCHKYSAWLATTLQPIYHWNRKPVAHRHSHRTTQLCVAHSISFSLLRVCFVSSISRKIDKVQLFVASARTSSVFSPTSHFFSSSLRLLLTYRNHQMWMLNISRNIGNGFHMQAPLLADVQMAIASFHQIYWANGELTSVSILRKSISIQWNRHFLLHSRLPFFLNKASLLFSRFLPFFVALLM